MSNKTESTENVKQYISDLEMMLRAAKRDLKEKNCVRGATMAHLKYNLTQLELFNKDINQEYLKEILNK